MGLGRRVERVGNVVSGALRTAVYTARGGRRENEEKVVFVVAVVVVGRPTSVGWWVE